MIKISIDGKEVNISVNGRIMEIVRDMVIAIDKVGDAIAENDESAAKFFNQTLSIWATGKSVGVNVLEAIGKLTEGVNDNDEKKVTVDDLIKDLKEREEHK